MTATTAAPPVQHLRVRRFRVDLGAETVRFEDVPCDDLEDALGGIARAFKLLEPLAVDDAYDPRATLILNLGILSGTQVMTGLRTFFHAYSPLKVSNAGKPSAMWTAGSCRFGTKLRALGVDEVVFTGRARRPTLLRIVPGAAPGAPARFLFEDGSDLLGRRVNDRIQTLHRRFPHAHFAVTGPAGDHWRDVRFAAIALSSESQLASGDPKPRWCGRGGIGGVMGSKHLVAIAADVEEPPAPPQPAGLKEINREIARGKGSARFRERSAGGGGGTWANYEALGSVHALPEMNFLPTGSDASAGLSRPEVEKGPWVVRAESCHRCGIRCHKNVHDAAPGGGPGSAGPFRAKLDYEPLNLLSSNLGIFDVGDACDLVRLCDEMGMDSISCGVTIAYAMEFNRRHGADGRRVAGGISFGDAAAVREALVDIGEGRLPELGQGTKRLADSLGATEFAMHSKGVEYPAYLPQTNPGYPFALAGGHMSMRTYLLLLYERETGLDYWTDAITRRGLAALRDDILGACKFAGLPDGPMAEAVRAATGLAITEDDLKRVVRRTYLRGWRIERRQGYDATDYAMPAEAHRRLAATDLPHFNTPEFFASLRDRVVATFDRMATEELGAL